MRLVGAVLAIVVSLGVLAEAGMNTPIGVAVTPDGARVYVASPQTNSVSVLDAKTKNVLATVTLTFSPITVTINTEGTLVTVANADTSAKIDTATNKIVK